MRLSNDAFGQINDFQPNKRPEFIKLSDLKRVWEKRKLIYIYREIAGKLTLSHRVRLCGKFTIQGLSPEIWATKDNRASFKNLIRCGSVWACAACSQKIRDERFTEISTITRGLQKDGYHLIFMTLTKTHENSIAVKYVTELFAKAGRDYRRITEQRIYKTLKTKYSIEYIKAFEITVSQFNGFHPHFHLIYAFKCPLSEVNKVKDEISQIVIDLWLSYNRGAMPQFQKAKLVYNEDISKEVKDYITRLDLCFEMTNKASAKRGKKEGHFNPLAIPEMLYANDLQGCTESLLQQIFDTYVKSSKGKRFLTFSKGLKDKYLIEEKTDEEICSDTKNLTHRLLTLSDAVWAACKKYKKIPEMLEAAEMFLNNPKSSLRDDVIKIGYSIGCEWEFSSDEPDLIITKPPRRKWKKPDVIDICINV